MNRTINPNLVGKPATSRKRVARAGREGLRRRAVVASKQTTAPAEDEFSDEDEVLAQQICDGLGLALDAPLTVDAIQSLRKPLPGYLPQVQFAARMLVKDAKLLNLKGVTPGGLTQASDGLQTLGQNERALERAYFSTYHQRMQVDDGAMGGLQKIARRVAALEEDYPALARRWKPLTDYLAKFRTGGSKATVETPPPADASTSSTTTVTTTTTKDGTIR